jgi:hypothetical protein
MWAIEATMPPVKQEWTVVVDDKEDGVNKCFLIYITHEKSICIRKWITGQRISSKIQFEVPEG